MLRGAPRPSFIIPAANQSPRFFVTAMYRRAVAAGQSQVFSGLGVITIVIVINWHWRILGGELGYYNTVEVLELTLHGDRRTIDKWMI
jgi:hypothetical protein